MRGDCLVEMGRIVDRSIDLVCCDLPYGATDNTWDAVIPFEPLWAHYARLLKPRGAILLTAIQPFTSALIASKRSWFRYEWIWHKSRPTGFLNARRTPLRNHESVLVFGINRPPYFPIMRAGPRHTRGGTGSRSSNWRSHRATPVTRSNLYYPRSVLQIASTRSVHPTAKPVELMEYLIRTYTRRGQTVLDNCMGSGTTGVAAVRTGRRFIGIELDSGYFELARRRIEAEVKRLS